MPERIKNMANEIYNTQDVIDSRDVIERIEELEAEKQELLDDIEEADEEDAPEIKEELITWIDQYGEELEALKKLAKDGEDYAPDWIYGAGLIHEDYFTEYCEDLCKDIGDIPQELPWYIANHIDWDGVASEIKMDYTEIDFDGATYYIR